ncbi:hypothetical protein FB475_4718 [Kribbella jejuensis]|uniref:Uncharacterized protein n=1 Tax=Kribbella jejuensis TaxID=236068 RepID=A0A542E8X6_9ACTN|nr:hypothetical protein FB475_4718 [Kribbella jejuensis]
MWPSRLAVPVCRVRRLMESWLVAGLRLVAGRLVEWSVVAELRLVWLRLRLGVLLLAWRGAWLVVWRTTIGMRSGVLGARRPGMMGWRRLRSIRRLVVRTSQIGTSLSR